MKKLRFPALLFFLIVAWGYSYPIMKVGIINLGPFTLNFFRFLLGTIVLILVIWFRNKKVNISLLPFPKVIFLGVLQTFMLFSLSGLGIQFIDSGETSILLYTMPIWTSILATFFLGEKIYFKKIVGFSLAVVGLLTILGNQIFLSAETITTMGYVLVLLAAIFWALANIYFKINFSDYDPLLITAAQMMVGCLLLGVLALLFEVDSINLQWTSNAVWSMLYLGIVASALCFVIWFYLIQNINLNTLTFASFLVPIIAILAGVTTINEPVTINKVLGAVILIIGAIVCQSKRVTNSYVKKRQT